MTMTAAETAEAVRTGARSAPELLEQALHRIATHDGDLRAFRTVRADQARAEAERVHAHPDRARLPLAGIPLAVKDNVPVAGEYLGNGTLAGDRTPQQADHEVVARLRRAGAVVVGLTNVPELCVFGATDSAATGITRNPWDLDRSPGGSSGGSAAAVAGGLVPAAHGNDGMGSIRIPAACTGLVGIKPGLGTVPSQLGNGSWFDMAENGPLATTVEDCALLLSVMAERPELAGPRDLDSRPRIGISVKAPLPGLPVDREYAGAALRAGDLLASAGFPVEHAELHYPTMAGPAALARWFAGAERDASTLDRSRLDGPVAMHARLGRLIRAAGGPRPGGRTAWQQAARRYFAQVDVLITPTLAQLPLPAHAWHTRSWAANVLASIRYAPFAAAWNLAGWPAMAVPAGVHPSGLPLSVQLVGPPGGEATLLAVARHLERLNPWPRVAPAYRAGAT
ncbi:MAG TPA: amidase family protein [Jatrophihabitans sp.]|nr:amidase family protein [Jatrophihabitans sp.]